MDEDEYRVEELELTLMAAAERCVEGKAAKLVRMLAAAGAEINGLDGQGRTPLHAAVVAGNWEAAAVLLELGADEGVRDLHGRTALWYAVELAGRLTGAA